MEYIILIMLLAIGLLLYKKFIIIHTKNKILKLDDNYLKYKLLSFYNLGKEDLADFLINKYKKSNDKSDMSSFICYLIDINGVYDFDKKILSKLIKLHLEASTNKLFATYRMVEILRCRLQYNFFIKSNDPMKKMMRALYR